MLSSSDVSHYRSVLKGCKPTACSSCRDIIFYRAVFPSGIESGDLTALYRQGVKNE